MFHGAVHETRSGEYSLLYKIHITIFILSRGMRHITVQRAEVDREKMRKGDWKSFFWFWVGFFSPQYGKDEIATVGESRAQLEMEIWCESSPETHRWNSSLDRMIIPCQIENGRVRINSAPERAVSEKKPISVSPTSLLHFLLLLFASSRITESSVICIFFQDYGRKS